MATEQNLPEADRPKWSNLQNPYPNLPNPHMPNRPQISLTREEIRVLHECNSESFWYRSLPACMICMFATQFAVARGILKPHPKYGAGLKTMGATLFGYIFGKMSYQPECRKKLMALHDNKPAAYVMKDNVGPKNSETSEFAPEAESRPAPDYSAGYVFDAKPEQPSETKAEADSKYRNYEDIRRQNREQYNERQIDKLQPKPVKVANQEAPILQPPEEEKGSRSIQYPRSSQMRPSANKYGDVWEE